MSGTIRTFSDVGTTLDAGDFGQVISTRDPRDVQLALKLIF